MITKVLIKITVIIIIFTVNICVAYLGDLEPKLVNSDLRLAAIGNLDLVVIGWDNEINAYDFGESPAGIIDDNNGKSTVYTPGAYGLTVFDDWPYDYEWDSYGLHVLGIAKVKSRFAIGGSFLKARADRKWRYIEEALPYSEHYDTYNGKVVSAYRVLPWFTCGFRGHYKKKRNSFETPYDWGYYESDKYIYEPAILINLSKMRWQIGLNYRLGKFGIVTTIHHFAIPIIYSSPKIAFGLKSSFGPIPHSEDWEKSIEFTSLYRVPTSIGCVNMGLLFSYITPQIWEEFRIWSSRGWQRKMGIGIAYTNNKIGMIGMQYTKYSIKNDVFDYSYTNHENNMHFGIELQLFKNLPIRLGYIYTGLEGRYSSTLSYDIITTGFGIKVPSVNLEIDFAYNSKFIRVDYYEFFEYFSYMDVDHLFGLSGRFIF